MSIDELNNEILMLRKEVKRLNKQIVYLEGVLERSKTFAKAKDSFTSTINIERIKQEKYMQALLDFCPESILIFDENSHLIYCTKSFLETYKVSDKIISMHYKKMFENGITYWGDNIESHFINCINNKTNAYFDAEINILDEVKNFRVFIYTLLNNDNKLYGTFIIFTDVTELVKSREIVIAASEAKGSFLANMSHEIRTPMNAIIGMANIGRSSVNIDKKDYCLDRIDIASKYLLGIINDVLDISKIESGKFELVYTEFNFDKMIDNIITVFNFKFNEKKQKLILQLDPNIPMNLISDEQRLNQVISNLLSNANKFTPENGEIILEAKLLEIIDKKARIKISITDTGIGISAENQQRLFKVFSQADNTISRKFGGSGLGLAICKKIIEMLNGDIAVISEEEKGSTFYFDIISEIGSDKISEIDINTVDFSKINILAIDDDLIIREYFNMAADHVGFKCDVATNAKEALKLISSNKYDIVFVDYKMPGMDGIEFSSKVREKIHKELVIIMISSTEWNDIKNEAEMAGIDSYLPKPLYLSSIKEMIARQLFYKQTISDTKDINDIKGIFKDYTILLAEDIEINKEIVESLLEETQVKIDWVIDGKKAYDSIKNNPNKYDLIFMDIQMPEMDGYTATKKIRSIKTKYAKNIPIIAMSANVFNVDIQKSLDSGMNDHIGKPIEVDVMINKLKTYLLMNN